MSIVDNINLQNELSKGQISQRNTDRPPEGLLFDNRFFYA